MAAVHAARDAGYWVRSGTVFEVSRSYLLFQLQRWIAVHNITTQRPMGTMAEDAEWLFLPSPSGALPTPPASLLLCPFAEEGALYGMDSHPCDLHRMAVKGELGTRDLFSWAQTMEHLMDPELAMVRIASHLAPRGWHLTSTPTHNLPHGEPWHFFHHTPAGLALLSERVGLAPVEVGYFGWLLYNADGYSMAFAKRMEPTGNNERERFWMGEGAAKNIWGGITTTLDGAAQSMLLSRKGCPAAADAAAAALRAVGARTVEEYAALRPPPASAATVMSVYTQWVKGHWGWVPTAADMAAVRSALGEAEDARWAAVLGKGQGQGHPLAPCWGDNREAGSYLALVGLREALLSAASGGGAAVGGPVLATEGGACLCAVASAALAGPFLGSACGQYEGGLPGATLAAARRISSGASLLLLEDLLEYTEDPLLALIEAFFALRPGGLLFVTARVVAPYKPYGSGRVLLRTLTATALLLSLKRAGFELLAASHWGSPHHIIKVLTSEGSGIAFAGLERGADLGGGSFAVAPSEWVSATISWALVRRPLENGQHGPSRDA